ncbi:MAG: SDR family oxidoreductase [Chloroflexi bacterium]|nr:SDR family oxidoreductase [Chloroflexota bacterium]
MKKSTGQLAGTVALVTGAGRGIGHATALALAANGATVTICARTPSEVADTADAVQALGGRVLARPADVADEAAVDALVADTVAMFGRLDTLIHCAAVIDVCRVVEMDTAAWDRVMAINLRGAFLCARAAMRAMAATGGHIILISSLSGVRGPEKFPGLAAYNVSKAGVLALSEILAVEGRPHGIRVNCVSPGAVDTAMLRQAGHGLRAGVTPEQVGAFLAALCRPDAALLTGANIEIMSNA